jgi:hypothetical protein
MTYGYSATFEFNSEAPETIKGELDAKSHASAARDAVKKLRAAHPGRKPTSILVLLDLRRGNDRA